MAGESEVITRKTRIDKALLVAGWQRIMPFRDDTTIGTAAIEEYPTLSGLADYILFHRGVPLAVVEGKKVSVAPQNAIVQAERYARGFQGSPFSYDEYKVPFAYSSNGTKIWFRDL